jgi:sec-independent protein translocase protein TatA
MDFFGIGAGELILILVVALIIWGPGKLPQIARTLGNITRNLRKATSDFTTALAREAELEEKTKPASPESKPADKPGVDEQ